MTRVLRAIVQLLDALALPRADVVGNSLGGRVALELGMDHPGRVEPRDALPALAWRAIALVPLPLARRLGLVQTRRGCSSRRSCGG